MTVTSSNVFLLLWILYIAATESPGKLTSQVNSFLCSKSFNVSHFTQFKTQCLYNAIHSSITPLPLFLYTHFPISWLSSESRASVSPHGQECSSTRCPHEVFLSVHYALSLPNIHFSCRFALTTIFWRTEITSHVFRHRPLIPSLRWLSQITSSRLSWTTYQDYL